MKPTTTTFSQPAAKALAGLIILGGMGAGCALGPPTIGGGVQEDGSRTYQYYSAAVRRLAEAHDGAMTCTYEPYVVTGYVQAVCTLEAEAKLCAFTVARSEETDAEGPCLMGPGTLRPTLTKRASSGGGYGMNWQFVSQDGEREENWTSQFALVGGNLMPVLFAQGEMRP